MQSHKSIFYSQENIGKQLEILSQEHVSKKLAQGHFYQWIASLLL